MPPARKQGGSRTASPVKGKKGQQGRAGTRKSETGKRTRDARGSGEPQAQRRLRPFRWLGRQLLLVFIWTAIAITCVLAYEATQLPDISDLDETTRRGGVRLMAADGSEFASFGAVHGQPVSLQQLPAHVVQALLATEDRRFFDHFGVDPVGILRAAYENFRSGRIRQGGSTLTQQLAKNLFLTAERSIERKLQELLLAFWLEASFSKSELLTIYLNRMYFGVGAFGIDAAARTYFDKPATELELRESAMLIGLLKAPSRFNPGVRPGLAAERTRQILLGMVDAGYIDRAMAEAAIANPPGVPGSASVSRQHRYFADWVLDQSTGFTGGESGDQQISTTLDRHLQSVAEAAVRDGFADDPRLNGVNVAMVVMSRDGAVRAMIGGLDYRASKFNRAVQAVRQPGSAFKPLVYLAALNAGYGPGTIISDAPPTINGWTPRNFDGRYRGSVTLEEALVDSLNAATVRLSEAVGRGRTLQIARSLGLTTNLGNHPSIALGAGEVSLLELTGAYAGFANGGYPVDAHGIATVRSADGAELYRFREPGRSRIASRQAIADLNRILRKVVQAGTGRNAAIGRLVAGKTGTSQEFRDAWFVGFAGNLVAGVWVGRDDAKPMDGVTGGQVPARIWARFMKAAL